MMKKQFFAVTFILSLAFASTAQAGGIPPNLKFTHIVSSGASPNRLNARNATYQFELHVVGKALSSISIELPPEIKANGEVDVTAQAGIQPKASVSLNGNKETITFSELIPPETTLIFYLHGVNNSGFQRIHLLPISGKLDGINQDLSFGMVRIQINDK